MKDKTLEANLSLIGAKIANGLNVNALKYMLPLWILPLSIVSLRCIFAGIVFWIISFTQPKENISRKDKIQLLLLGMICIYAFFAFYQMGINKTTPISSSIFSSLQPIWVFLIAAFFYKEKVSTMKIVGIIIGFGGALLCILTQQSNDLASDAFTGNMLCLISSIAYALYLTFEKKIIERGIPIISILKYIFTGASISSIIALLIDGFHAPMFDLAFDWRPYAVLVFVLIFPTVIGYLLIPIGLKYLSTTVVAIYGYLSLIVVAIVSLILGQDRFSWTQFISILLICSSVYFVEIAEKKAA